MANPFDGCLDCGMGTWHHCGSALQSTPCDKNPSLGQYEWGGGGRARTSRQFALPPIAGKIWCEITTPTFYRREEPGVFLGTPAGVMEVA